MGDTTEISACHWRAITAGILGTLQAACDRETRTEPSTYPYSSRSSQANSAGSIPATRSTREKRCSTIELEDSSFLLIRVFGPYSGHYGPRISTPRRSPSTSEGRSALTSCRRVFISISTEYGASETWPPTLDPSCALIGDVRKITGITRMSGRPHIDTSANFPLRACARIHARPDTASSRQVGIRVVDQELAGGIVPNESLAV